MACQHCPCPDICPQRSDFCTWAAKEPHVEFEMRHICGRAVMPDVSLPPSYPSLSDQAKGLAAMLWRFARSGFSITTRIEARRRRLICEGCDKFDQVATRCTACGCLVNIKPWMSAAACPLGKWSTPEPGTPSRL